MGMKRPGWYTSDFRGNRVIVSSRQSVLRRGCAHRNCSNGGRRKPGFREAKVVFPVGAGAKRVLVLLELVLA